MEKNKWLSKGRHLKQNTKLASCQLKLDLYLPHKSVHWATNLSAGLLLYNAIHYNNPAFVINNFRAKTETVAFKNNTGLSNLRTEWNKTE